MSVHVEEIHAQVTDAGGARGAAATPPADPAAAEDAWRRTEERVTRLRCRVAAEGFDD